MRYMLIATVLLSLLAGCSTTSISSSGFKRGNYGVGGARANAEFQVELDELEVLGISVEKEFGEQEIEKTYNASKPIALRKGSRLLLVQSGAEYPDSEMVQSLSNYWDLSTLSGDNKKFKGANINKMLRYTAAAGGMDFVVVYWGSVETADSHLHTKSVSWVPFIGWSLPDEAVSIRVVIKFAVIDVVTGQWFTYMSEPIEDEFLSTIINRDGRQQGKEIELKKAVYEKAALALYSKFNF